MIVGHTRTPAPVIGYRAFVARRRGLRSLAFGLDYWPAEGREAFCAETGRGSMAHTAPAPGCSCGLYALSSIAGARRYAREFRRWRPSLLGRPVLAAVLLWSAPGRPMIVGELADRPGLQYRAPYGRVLALADDGRHARRAAARLGLPVVRPDYLSALSAEIAGNAVHLADPRAGADAVRSARRFAARTRPQAALALPALAGLALWSLLWLARAVWWALPVLGRLAVLGLYLLARLGWLVLRLVFLVLLVMVDAVLPRPAQRRNW